MNEGGVQNKNYEDNTWMIVLLRKMKAVLGATDDDAQQATYSDKVDLT